MNEAPPPPPLTIPTDLAEAIAHVATMAKLMRAMVDAFTAEGFTEPQALYLAAAQLGGARQ